MSPAKALTLSSLASLILFAAPAGEEPALRGYSAEGARAQREWETKYRAIPRASEIGAPFGSATGIGRASM